MSLDVFVLPTGRPYFDLIFAGVPRWVSPGEEIFAERFATCAGGSFNATLALHRLGLAVGFCAYSGTDFFSQAIKQAAVDAGISTDYLIEVDRPMAAVTASLSRVEDRGFVSYVDPSPPFDPEDLPEHGVPSVILIPGLPDSPEELFSYLDQKKKAGATLVCDSAHVERDIEDRTLAQLIARLDLFLCNEKEAFALTHRSDPEQAARVIGRLCPHVVVKLGPEGALALASDRVVRERAMPICPEDSTGAGDGFNAGYLYGLLKGVDVQRRLRLGNVVGGCVTAGLGSTNAPTLETVLALEKKHFSGQEP